MKRLSGCRCFAASRGCSRSRGAAGSERAAGSRAARPPRRTSRSPFRPAAPPERADRGRRHQGQRAARRRGRQLQADPRRDRHRQRRDRRGADAGEDDRQLSADQRRPATTRRCGDRTASRWRKNAWRLTVTRIEPHVFSWKLDGKPKAADDSAFVTILSGTHTRAVDATAVRSRTTAAARSSSTGTWRRRCPSTTTRSGVATFTYSRARAGRRSRRSTSTSRASRTTRPRPSSTTPSTATPRRRARAASSSTPRSVTTSRSASVELGQGGLHHPQPLAGVGRRPHRLPADGRRRRDGAASRRVTVSECWDTSLPVSVPQCVVRSHAETGAWRRAARSRHASFLTPSL